MTANRFQRGDLLRMCTHGEADHMDPDLIDWCYGLYVGKQQDNEAEEHGWIPRTKDLILCEERIQAFDHYWYVERIS
jgi:hypothetical protein